MESISQVKKILKVCKLSEKASLPTKATPGSAGMDLYSCVDSPVVINPGETVKIPCGISISLPCSEYAAFIFARSGLAIKHGITLANAVGVIDSDYRGEICVGLCNISKNPYVVSCAERIAQMIVMKVESFDIFEAEKLDNTLRGNGGFGSTGK